jgi:SNF2 family DNA or RNA helicase
MGLGKTIQALAVLLDRAKQGSALVVAPASVVRNWFHETNRFAPTLRPLIFGQGDRREMLDNLQPFDLLLCSYGLMQQESDMLTDKTFATIVLDEAQAIKNRATKRSQTAMQLQGDFKIITTGTPVENHLGELWNLFSFLNPGLLGSLERFNERFAFPIEKNQDKERRTQLRRLLQPFILRRRKNDVLDELPEKTEVTLSVELSPEERAFYEALRRQALENIEAGDGDAGDKRFKILAELMRLRQACCHPRMVAPESKLSSSKLGLFAETVEELLSEGHKALVFSQFVKHLKIVEEWVKEQRISYQYLDGLTPLPQRDKAIRAFQGGEGDLFLISLKAGGFGLNLTAADYVIHLDPWWNPAVEDQASDRAHRIGQQRPVTIYRLITEDTIEEKIVKLHADKRELADSLLEGAEVSGKLSAEELLELIRS